MTEYPIYRTLFKGDGFEQRIAEAETALHDCRLCGNNCGIDRTKQSSPCQIGSAATIASYGPHHGEEDVLRGWQGSGTIFFSGCNLHCVYCQNHDISQTSKGFPVTARELAHIMLNLQERGCHNINLVSPTHVASHIVPALVIAAQADLHIPIVYNSGGYDAPQALALMDGLVDIYMPDMKYSDADAGYQLSLVRDYPTVNQMAVKEMHRQVGNLVTDDRGLALRGLLVRHLVLPGGLAGTSKVASYLAKEISTHTYLNLLAQYHPSYQAWNHTASGLPLDRRITRDEFQQAQDVARNMGLYRFDR